MSVDKLINLRTIGLGVTLAEVAEVARAGRQVSKAIVASYILAPAAAIGLTMLFHPYAMAAAGLHVATVCPGAPFTAMAKGDGPFAVGLMVILAGSSAVVAPLLLSVLLPLVGGGEQLRVDAVKIVATLVVCQLIPLCIGLVLRRPRGELAERLKKPATRLGILLNIVVFVAILAVQFQMLRHLRLIDLIGVFLMVLAFTLAGWVLGDRGTGKRKAMALSSGVRNVGVSPVIATGGFPGTPAVTAAMVFAIFQTIVLAVVAAAWGRLSPVETGKCREVPV
jgi:bile acid:Na+ symporter, BASS family